MYLWGVFDASRLQSDWVHGRELHARKKVIEFVVGAFVCLELVRGTATTHACIGEVSSPA